MLHRKSKVMLGLCQLVLWPVPVQEQQQQQSMIQACRQCCRCDAAGSGVQVRNVLLTVALFCGPMLICFSFLNTVAIAYHSTAALPFGTICVIFVIWALITFPLTVLGGIAGKNKQVCHMASK